MTGEISFRVGNVREDFITLVRALEIVKVKGKEEWEVFDVIHSLVTDPNTFFFINENDIVVLNKNEKLLWVWCFYAEGGDAYAKYMDHFMNFAKQIGCTSIGFDSSRKAYQRMLYKLPGAYIKKITYQIDIEEKNYAI